MMYVFLDTNTFVKMRYNFTSSPLSRLKKYIDIGILKLLSNDIVIREVEKHIRCDAELNSAQLRNAVKKMCFREILDEYPDLSHDFRKDKWDEKIISKFQNYIKSCNCIVLNNEEIKTTEVFNDYFENKPPFENRKEKKSEFPDTVIIKSIKKFASDNKKIYVITEDMGWEKAFKNMNISVFENIQDLLIEISSKYADDYSSKYIEYLGENKQELSNKIERWFYDIDIENLISNNLDLEIDEINEFNLEKIKLKFNGFEFIDECEASAQFEVELTFNVKYEYNDYSMASFDKEDDCYYNVKNGTAEEKRYTYLDFNVSMINDNDTIEIDDLEFTNAAILDSTLIESKTEEHEYVEDEYDDESFYEKSYDTCPDCGKPINLNNDGGNGFCTDCAYKH